LRRKEAVTAQLTPLMHSELVKERGEEDNIYLVPVS